MGGGKPLYINKLQIEKLYLFILKQHNLTIFNYKI